MPMLNWAGWLAGWPAGRPVACVFAGASGPAAQAVCRKHQLYIARRYGADTDVAYTVKPVWDSYLAFIEQAQADGAWQQEGPGERWILLNALLRT